MESDEGLEEDDFYNLEPSISGITLSHMNNKSSVLCPETQDITSQYLALQQLNAHQKLVSRAKGRVDSTPPKSMESYLSVSSQKKKKLLKRSIYDSKNVLQNGFLNDEHHRPLSSRLTVYNSEEDEVLSTNASNVHKCIQAGIPVSDFTCKTAEKITWYLEALSLGELQSQYFAFMDGINSNNSLEFNSRGSPNPKGRKKIVKGDILEWHKKCFVEPKKQFCPRILASPDAKSKVRDMRCYNPPFRKSKKKANSQSSDTFESLDEEENDDEISENDESLEKSENSSSIEEEIPVSRKQPILDLPRNDSVHLLPRRRIGSRHIPPVLSKTEEDKYLDFLSKVTEDILRSGVYSDKAIQQAFEFHLQFYKDDPNKEKLQALLQQVMEGLKITDEERLMDLNNIFTHSRPTTPPEKEISSSGFSSDTLKMPAEFNSSATSELVNNIDGSNLNDS